MTKVLVVDDHESMRESLERLFNESGDFCVVGGISCADHAVRMCGELSPDIVFMDVCTEGGASGLRATKEVRDAFPDIKVIVMTAFDEISYAPRAKEAGAHAFIYKSRSLSEFEQTARGTVAVALGHFRTTEPKGEFVIGVAGKPKVRRVREDGEE